MLSAKLIGARIAEARKKSNISQAELAQQLFISSQAVGKWERGESMPDIITLNRLAEILSVTLNYFSEGTLPAATETPDASFAEKQPAEMPVAKPEKKLSWDMSRGNWVDADFSGLKNLHEKFSSSNLQRCTFIGSDLSGLLLKNNHVDGCNFSGSNIGNSRIQNSHFGNNLFQECSLAEAELHGSHIKNCNFTGADLTGAVIKSCAFAKNTLVQAVLNRTAFQDTALNDTVFEGKLEDCSFENCGFSKVIFRHSTLLNTFFKGRNLRGIQFIACQADRMTYEFLKNGKADLTGLTILPS